MFEGTPMMGRAATQHLRAAPAALAARPLPTCLRSRLMSRMDITPTTTLPSSTTASPVTLSSLEAAEESGCSGVANRSAVVVIRSCTAVPRMWKCTLVRKSRNDLFHNTGSGSGDPSHPAAAAAPAGGPAARAPSPRPKGSSIGSSSALRSSWGCVAAATLSSERLDSRPRRCGQAAGRALHPARGRTAALAAPTAGHRPLRDCASILPRSLSAHCRLQFCDRLGRREGNPADHPVAVSLLGTRHVSLPLVSPLAPSVWLHAHRYI